MRSEQNLLSIIECDLWWGTGAEKGHFRLTNKWSMNNTVILVYILAYWNYRRSIVWNTGYRRPKKMPNLLIRNENLITYINIKIEKVSFCYLLPRHCDCKYFAKYDYLLFYCLLSALFWKLKQPGNKECTYVTTRSAVLDKFRTGQRMGPKGLKH